MRLLPAFLLLSLVAACRTPDGAAPSLAPRAAEAIDPRVPVVREAVVQPVSPAVAARLAELVALARDGDAAFRAAAARAEQLAGAAGPRESESWVVAQEALSAAVSARGPTTRALGDVDAMMTGSVSPQGPLPASDLAAIEAAAAEIAAVDRRQADRVAAIAARLRS